MINSIGVKNFRSFKDNVSIEIKPITVFVGKNSSGKSSLLRTFPLFRQSVEENTTGPILWYGRYVDFGDFDEVISKDSNDDTISFNFNLNIEVDKLSNNYRYSKISLSNINNIIVQLVVSSKNKKTKTKEIKISFNDVKIKIQIDDSDSAKINFSHRKSSIDRDGISARNLGRFIPDFITRKKEDSINSINKLIPRYYPRDPRDNSLFEGPMFDTAVKLIAPYFHSKTSQEKIALTLTRIGLNTEAGVSYLLKNLFKEQRVFCKNIEAYEDEIISKLYPYIIACNLNPICNIINTILSETFISVKYIAPLRATSERFYRFQDLQVDEIDHTGSNLAMLLNSLKPIEKIAFEKWTSDNFGFFVRVKQVGAHFAVTITTENNDKEFNVSDMGFGYSQVLPIITTIWIETERKLNRLKKPIIFIIEQPELHLHPAYQHNLARIFAKVISQAKEKGIDLRIIFETHSQNMIEALGECIEDIEMKIEPEDISILVFDKDDNNQTSVTTSYFNEAGFLKNWPIGFFSGRNQ